MKTLKILVLVVALIGFKIQAEEYTVVDVKSNIKLSDDDNVYKDFYINAGDGSSLKKNLVVKVKRKIQVKESPTKNVGDFDAVVGQLKIIQVGNKVSVAREFKLTPRDEEPMLEQIGIMSGDRVDLSGSFIDNSKPNYKHKTTENDTPKKDEPIKTASAEDPSTASTVDANSKLKTVSSVVTTTNTQVTTTTVAPVVPTAAAPPAATATSAVTPTTAPAQTQAAPPPQENVNARKPASVEPTLLQKIIPMPSNPGN
ncbi:MAG: hypothetical protein ACXWQQ_03725 [Pseudobdellovibrio sp.]